MITLRPLDIHELVSASKLCLRSKGYWGYSDTFISACEAELTLSKSDIERDAVVAAVVGPTLMGVAQVSSGETGCFLEKLFVDPPHMGAGVGRKLFQWSVEAARGFGGAEMIIEADPGAVPFYVAMGCKQAGTVPSGSIPGRRLPRLIYDLQATEPPA